MRPSIQLVLVSRPTNDYALVVLSMREVETREFGQWAMAYRAPDAVGNDDALGQIERSVARAAPAVRATFESFVGLRASR